MNTNITIKDSILRAIGKKPSELESDVIEIIVKGVGVHTDALVNLILLVTGRDIKNQEESRFAARNVATRLVGEFRKKNPETEWDIIALAVIKTYFTDPKLVATALLKIGMSKEEKAV